MPEIKQFPKMRIACVSRTGPYGQAVKSGFESLFAWLAAIQRQPIGPSMSIFHDDPAHVAVENLRSEHCVPVAPDVQGSGEVSVKDVGDTLVASIVYQGGQNSRRAYNELYDWLHAQGYHEAGSPMEIYYSRLGEEMRAEVVVPIEKVEALPPGEKIEALPAPNEPAANSSRTKAPRAAGKKSSAKKRKSL